MGNKKIFSKVIDSFRSIIKSFPDKRKGKNKSFSMEDIVLSGFSVFYTQSPSFLFYQKAMKEAKGKSNAETLFGITDIPSDNHIRDILDEVNPELVYPLFDDGFNLLEQNNHLDIFKAFSNNILIALDGTWYFSSKSIHCDNCSTMNHKNGTTTYYHSAITPVVVVPGYDKVIALPPEFIIPQDGHKKQDCEINAGKRWINKHIDKYKHFDITMLGDDLYCNDPMCKKILNEGCNFIFVCKPDSHKTLYKWLDSLEPEKEIFQKVIRKWTGKRTEIYTYRFANHVPIREGDDALMVNWCELVITTEEGKIVYKNGFATNHRIHHKNVEAVVEAGRSRWKIENENNNTLKTKGYNLEHNFGHGKKHLSSFLATLNLFAFLFHSILDIMDDKYRLLRNSLATRKTFFDDIRALTRYICFDSWEHVLDFMIEGLEIEFIDTS